MGRMVGFAHIVSNARDHGQRDDHLVEVGFAPP